MYKVSRNLDTNSQQNKKPLLQCWHEMPVNHHACVIHLLDRGMVVTQHCHHSSSPLWIRAAGISPGAHQSLPNSTNGPCDKYIHGPCSALLCLSGFFQHFFLVQIFTFPYWSSILSSFWQEHTSDNFSAVFFFTVPYLEQFLQIEGRILTFG